MKKIAILGSNGYIARNLKYILEKEHPEYEIWLYGIEPASVDGYANYTRVDVTDPESIRNLDLDCDIVYDLVGRTGTMVGFEQYKSFIDINETALLNLLTEYRRQNSHAKIVFPSTRLVYKGSPASLSEDAEKEFKTIYAINKFACEQYLEQYNRMFGVQYCVFRICVPYGTMISDASSYGTAEFMLGKASKGENISLYGDGSVRRTLTFMADLCKTLAEGGISDKCVNDIYNIGGENYSLREMAEPIAAKYGVKVEYVPWPEGSLLIESGDTVFDSSKLDALIGKHTTSHFADWIEGRI